MASRNPTLLRVCDELEQALATMPQLNGDCVRLRLRIEEAIEMAYEIVYSAEGRGRGYPDITVKDDRSRD